MDPQQINMLIDAAKTTYGNGGGTNWPMIISWLIFGTIGFVACFYGWKQKEYKPLVIGLILSIYPYFVPNVFLSYAIGIALTAALYFWRE